MTETLNQEQQAAQQEIDEAVKGSPVILFMKGTPDFPQCGFSARTVQVLRDMKAPFSAVNVLADDRIREGIKRYGDWPTIPQLYIGGELVGGCDIVLEMHETGELDTQIKAAIGKAD